MIKRRVKKKIDLAINIVLAIFFMFCMLVAWVIMVIVYPATWLILRLNGQKSHFPTLSFGNKGDN